MTLPGTEMEYKRFRTASSETSPTDFHKGQSSGVDLFPNHSTTVIRYLLKLEHKSNRIKHGNLRILIIKGITFSCKYLPSV